MSEIFKLENREFDRCPAYYSTLMQYIHFKDIKSFEIEDAINFPLNFDNLVNKKTILHEFQHYIDHITTLWGISNFISIYNAYNVFMLNKDYEFFKIKQVINELKSTQFEEYYTVVNEIIYKQQKSNLWIWQLSTGLRFTADGYLDKNKPIFFTNFHLESGEKVLRIPITIGSLLECRAMAIEIELEEQNIKNTKDISLKESFTNSLKNNTQTWLFDPHKAIYSVAVHFLSNHFKIHDIFEAFKISYIISGIALNLPAYEFTKIKIPDKYSNTWPERVQHFLSNKDRGFIYSCLILNYSDHYISNQILDMNLLLEKSNLQNQKMFNDNIEKEFEGYENNIEEGLFNAFVKDKFNSGTNLLRKILANKTDTFKIFHNKEIKFSFIAPDEEIEPNDFPSFIPEKEISFIQRKNYLEKKVIPNIIQFANICGV